MRVFVTVGTDHHPFDRLIEWVERWAAAHPHDVVVVQHGTTRAPEGPESYTLLGASDMDREFRSADVAVVSAGPGAVMHARSCGLRPVAVARRHSLGEHVDDHQRAFTAHMARREMVWEIEDRDAFEAILDRARQEPSEFRCEPSEEAVPAAASAFGALVEQVVRGRRVPR